MSTPKKIRPPRGMRLRRVGEIVRKTDLRYSFDFSYGWGNPSDVHWGTMDSWDRANLIGKAWRAGDIPIACRKNPSRKPKYPWRTMKRGEYVTVGEISGKVRPKNELLEHARMMSCQWNRAFNHRRKFVPKIWGDTIVIKRTK